MAVPLLLVSILRACVELAGFALLARRLALLAGPKRSQPQSTVCSRSSPDADPNLYAGLPSLVRDRHL